MASKHMKRYSISSAIREMQTKNTMRYFYTLLRMAKIVKADNAKMWSHGNAHSLLVEMQMVLWRTVWEFLTKLNILLPYDQVIVILGFTQLI